MNGGNALLEIADLCPIGMRLGFEGISPEPARGETLLDLFQGIGRRPGRRRGEGLSRLKGSPGGERRAPEKQESREGSPSPAEGGEEAAH